jgi:hypothetical protein
VSLSASATLTNQDVGKTFFAAGSGALTVTMPDPTTCEAGTDILVLNTVDQNLLVTSTSKLITLNNATASTVAFQTSSEKIGGGFLLTSTGTKWHVGILAEETQTVTVS